MFELEKFLDWFERPERSGWLSMIICTSIMLGYILPILSPCDPLNSLPGLCIERKKEPEIKRERITWIRFTPGAPGKPLCTCHYDVRFFGGQIQHLRSKDGAMLCEGSEHDWAAKTWTEPKDSCAAMSVQFHCYDVVFAGRNIAHTEMDYDLALNHGEGEYRLHCDDDQ